MFLLNPVEYSLVGAVLKATLLPRLFVILVSGAEPLGPEVEGVSEWFVDAIQNICACHEDSLECCRA